MAPYNDTIILLFGGRDKQQYFHDLWRFSVDDLTWTPLAVVGDYPVPTSLPLFGEIRSDLWIVAGGDNAEHTAEITLAEFTTPDRVLWRRLSQSSSDRAYLNLGVILGQEPFLVVEKSPSFGEQLRPGLGSFKMTLSRLATSTSSWVDVAPGSESPAIRSGATLTAVGDTHALLFGGYMDGRILDELWSLEIRDQANHSIS